MLKTTLMEVVLFSLPFSLFFLYRTFIVQHRRLEGEAFDPRPYHLSFILGGVLALSFLIFLNLSHKGARDGVFIPSHLENGKVVRGKIVPEKSLDDSGKRETDEPSRPTGPQDH